MTETNLTDLGHIIEGIVERDPLTDDFQIYTKDPQGNSQVIRPNDLLSKYEGQEVKFTLASLDTIRTLVESLGGEVEGVACIMPDDIPGATVHRTRLP